MTDLLSRPILRVPQQVAGPDRPVALAAAAGAVAVALGGLMLCLAAATAGWFAADVGTFTQGLRVGALSWLAGNGSSLSGGRVALSVVPLGSVAACGYALYRAGRWAAGTSSVANGRDVGVAVAAAAAGYALPGVLVAALVQVGGVHAPLPRTAAAFAIIAALSSGAGLLRGSGHAGSLVGRLPEEVRAAVTGGAGAALLMVAVGALAFCGALILHFQTALRLSEGFDAGLVGGVLLALIGLAFVPNAVLCAAAYAAGPGFALGAGTNVSPTGVHLGLLPDFPMLAAVPVGTAGWWVPGLIAVPVVAGLLGGAVAGRRYPAFGLDRVALRGALAGVAGASMLGLGSLAATGSVAPGRLRTVGPDVLGTTAVCLVAFVLGGAVGAVAYRLATGWRARAQA